MLESFEYKGIFWLPSNPEDLKPGILKFTPEEGANLELIGGRFPQDVERFHELIKEKIVLGVISKGTPVTLFNCLEIKFGSGFSSENPSYWSSVMKATVVFMGAHFSSEEEIKFKSISTRYLFLDDWLNLKLLNVERENEETITIKVPFSQQEILLYSDNELKITASIIPELRFTYFHPTRPKSVEAVQPAYINLETKEPKNLECLLSYGRIVQHFLTLAAGKPVYPLIIRGKTESGQEVDIFYTLPRLPEEIPSSTRMLFTYQDISHRCQEIFANLLEKEKLLQPVFLLYFGTLYNPKLYLENKFLSLVSALESLHSRSEDFEDAYIPPEEYEVVSKQLIETIETLPTKLPSALKDRLKEIIRHGNGKSLRSRLKDILKHYGNITQLFIDDFDAFIQKVIQTRNFYTHYGENLEQEAAEGSELFRLNLKLNLLLKICLLRELGFTIEEIKNMPSIQEEIKFLTGQNEIPWE
jgi:hypothetical protein